MAEEGSVPRSDAGAPRQNGSQGGENASDPAANIPGIGNNLLGVLGSTVDGLQNSLGTAYANMAGTLAQSVNMMKVMNTLMEDFLKQSVRIESNIQYKSDGASLLKLSITNCSRFPLGDATMKLDFVKRNTVDPALFVCTMEDESDMSDHFACFEMPPESTVTHPILIKAPYTAQFNCTCTVSFPSPGTGQNLAVEHTFGVYLLHQCGIERCEPGTERCQDAGGRMVDVVDGYSFRRLFRVRATQGLPAGSLFRITVRDRVVDALVEVLEETTDGDGIMLSVEAAARPTTADAAPIDSPQQKRMDGKTMVAALVDEIHRLTV